MLSSTHVYPITTSAPIPIPKGVGYTVENIYIIYITIPGYQQKSRILLEAVVCIHKEPEIIRCKPSLSL